MCKFFSFCLFVTLSGLYSYAQDAKPDAYQDSLQTIIDSNVSKTLKKDALFLLGEHLVQRDPDRAENIANKLQEA
ncbi:hypothetical protein [Meridianimaribacter flavus]|uniref:HEAT repeat domain-containing protein n=2 Tax=Flavobacteriaceae TaxID=49546 RepID=A0ABY2G2X8_9FLAO|nr:hypothetical protein [Meridianimaribacter flavus]TDY10644.1 hypothetical protein A8975_2372 [Meridianimaribacter flavus]